MSEQDPAAFEQWYREHAFSVRNFLRFYIRDHATAEDLTQDTFLQIWRKPNGFDPKRSTIRAYLLGIARKKAADLWRHRGAQTTEPPDAATNENEQGLLLGDALAALAPELRTVLWLREVEGYSYNEAAQILDIPIGTVRSRLFSAREQLRLIWGSQREKESDL
jgi:RNA polymerase sigma-70 factor (ECF subfamily)